MADIRVEKKRTSVWPWILGLLVAALLIWALASLFDRGEDEVQVVEPAAEVGVESGPASPLREPDRAGEAERVA